MEKQKIIQYLKKINDSDKSLDFINDLSQELYELGTTHLSIECQIGFILWENELYQESLDKFKFIIRTELENYNFTYDTVFSDAVGVSASFLIDKFYKNQNSDYYDLFLIGFCYLSKHLEKCGNQMCDSLRYRAYLSDNCQQYAQRFGMKQLNSISVIPIPMTISDYVNAAVRYEELGMRDQGNECMQRAFNLHSFLEDITIAGKDADSYLLPEIAEIGSNRLEQITKNINIYEIINRKKLHQILAE